MELGHIVHDFTAGMEAADRRRPRASSSSTAGRFYQPGTGPFRETEAVALTLAELRTVRSGVYAHAGKRRYPASRNECDLAVGELPDWAIEVKMARLRRDNGDYEDTTKKILSPYPDDRSAVTDCRELASSGFGDRQAILIYGFEDPARPITWLIEAFELIAATTVTLGPRETAPLKDLVHPVFAAGHVWGWEVLGSRSDSNVPTHQADSGPPGIRSR
jgi:hypothetical protein